MFAITNKTKEVLLDTSYKVDIALRTFDGGRIVDTEKLEIDKTYIGEGLEGSCNSWIVELVGFIGAAIFAIIIWKIARNVGGLTRPLPALILLAVSYFIWYSLKAATSNYFCGV